MKQTYKLRVPSRFMEVKYINADMVLSRALLTFLINFYIRKRITQKIIKKTKN